MFYGHKFIIPYHTLSLCSLCCCIRCYRELQCVPDVWSLIEWSNWLTPENLHRRYDTVFYLCCVEEKQEPSADYEEISSTQVCVPVVLIQSSGHMKINQLLLLHVSCLCARECFLECCVCVCKGELFWSFTNLCVLACSWPLPFGKPAHARMRPVCLFNGFLGSHDQHTVCLLWEFINVQADICLYLKGKCDQIVPVYQPMPNR